MDSLTSNNGLYNYYSLLKYSGFLTFKVNLQTQFEGELFSITDKCHLSTHKTDSNAKLTPCNRCKAGVADCISICRRGISLTTGRCILNRVQTAQMSCHFCYQPSESHSVHAPHKTSPSRSVWQTAPDKNFSYKTGLKWHIYVDARAPCDVDVIVVVCPPPLQIALSL